MKRLSRKYSWIRLTVFLSFTVFTVGTLFLFNEFFAWMCFFAGLLLFNGIAFFHRRVDGAVRRLTLLLEIKKSQSARMSVDWDCIPRSFGHDADHTHPFGVDLDISGEHSIHRLLDVSVSREGSRLLSDWLMNPVPDLKMIEKRRRIVRELIPMTWFRDRLLLRFCLLNRENLDGGKLIRWLKKDVQIRRLKTRLFAAAGLVVTNGILFAFHRAALIPPVWLLSFTVYIVFFMANVHLLNPLLTSVESLDDELGKFRTVLGFLETYPYGEKKHLKAFCHPFLNPGERPSTILKTVKRVTVAAGLRMNAVMTVLLNLTFPWDFLTAYQIDNCRRRVSDLLPVWLDTWAELEGMISLATFSYLNPAYVFPEFLDVQKGNEYPLFEAKGLGHPLIPGDRKVVNDFSLPHSGEVVLITGSNMSGKSTFLKTVGVNLCLAFAGGPVSAESLRMIPCRLFTCLRINDSLTDGFSYFYAEVKRLKRLLDSLSATHDYPLIYLIDEIFRGTNNRERLTGGRTYIKAAAGLNGAGLIATHDLDLGKLAGESPDIRNVHFREEVRDGWMIFDYMLRPGLCPTTNALKIMKQEGLPVED